MSFSASDVMKLRAETDAPMMECKAALEEADGNFERAKEILREKGKAAAAKRADRATGAGCVAIAKLGDKIAGVVVECETDFVAINPDFKSAVQGIANAVAEGGSAGMSVEDALGLAAGDKTVNGVIEGLVASIRENIQLKKVLVLSGSSYGFYVHHDGKTAAIVELSGSADELGKEIGMQVVSLSPEVVNKDQLSQDRLAKEMEVEITRAMEEGKPREMAEKIAHGRVNKEFVKSAVLLEQDFIKDQKKSVAQHIKESAGDLKVIGFHKLMVGG